MVAILQGLIMWGFAALIFRLIETGEMERYLHPAFIKWQWFAMGMFLVLGTVQIMAAVGRWRRRGMSPALLIAFLVPLLLAWVVSPTILGSAVVQQKGLNIGNRGQATLPFLSSQRVTAVDQGDTIRITDDNFVDAIWDLYAEPERFDGKQVTIEGFVVKLEEFAEDEFLVARLVVTCHVAHAVPDGLLAVYDVDRVPRSDTWVRMAGRLELSEYYGHEILKVHVEHLEPIAIARSPYIMW